MRRFSAADGVGAGWAGAHEVLVREGIIRARRFMGPKARPGAASGAEAMHIGQIIRRKERRPWRLCLASWAGP